MSRTDGGTRPGSRSDAIAAASSSAKKGLPSERAWMRSSSAGSGVRPRISVSISRWSVRPSGRSSIRETLGQRVSSARRTRSASPCSRSSVRNVPINSSRPRRIVRTMKTRRSLEAGSLQWRSSRPARAGDGGEPVHQGGVSRTGGSGRPTRRARLRRPRRSRGRRPIVVPCRLGPRGTWRSPGAIATSPARAPMSSAARPAEPRKASSAERLGNGP
jgi:hypothetical protein